MKAYKETVDGLVWLHGVVDEKGQPAGPGPEGMRYEHRTRINAPKSVVWSVLSDVDHWGEWAVLYPKASGVMKKDSQINLDIFVPGTKAVPSKAEFLEVEPEKFVMFHAHPNNLPGNMANGVRYFQIEEVSETQCVVTDGEVVCGKIGIQIAKHSKDGVFKGLQAMNEGLKARAEAAVRNANEKSEPQNVAQ